MLRCERDSRRLLGNSPGSRTVLQNATVSAHRESGGQRSPRHAGADDEYP